MMTIALQRASMQPRNQWPLLCRRPWCKGIDDQSHGEGLDAMLIWPFQRRWSIFGRIWWPLQSRGSRYDKMDLTIPKERVITWTWPFPKRGSLSERRTCTWPLPRRESLSERRKLRFWFWCIGKTSHECLTLVKLVQNNCIDWLIFFKCSLLSDFLF